MRPLPPAPRELGVQAAKTQLPKQRIASRVEVCNLGAQLLLQLLALCDK